MSLNISNSAYLNSLNRPAAKVVGSNRIDFIQNSTSVKATAKTESIVVDNHLNDEEVAKPQPTNSFQQQPKFELSPSQSERIVHLYHSNKAEEAGNSAISQYLNTENIAQQDALKSSLVGLDIYV